MAIRFRHRLSFRQAVNTVFIAFLLGMILSVIQIGYDFFREQKEVDNRVIQLIGMLKMSASQAVFYVDRPMIDTVINGLFEYQPICEAKVIDEFDAVLGYNERPLVTGKLKWLVKIAFGQKKSYTVPLFYETEKKSVGLIKVSVDSYLIATNFISRAGMILISGLIRNIVLSGTLMLFFYYSLTRPLLRMTKNVESVDPAQPASRMIEIPHNHEKDEMGQLVRTINILLERFEESLERRRAAEKELKIHQEHLEHLVAERTRELSESLEQQHQTNLQLNEALERVEEANKEIIAGIHYAKTIQQSLLPNADELKTYLPKSLLIWIPKEIVSGDIVFTEFLSSETREKEDASLSSDLLVVVADCTGHGVPGAFMTMIVATGLRRIIRDEECHDPAEILKRLNFIVKTMLHQDMENTFSNDGLDAAICLVKAENENRTLTFAGAKRPLIHIQNDEMNFIKGDRMSLGYKESDLKFDFTNHTFTITNGSYFYMYSDGFEDQLDEACRRTFGKKRFRNLLKEIAFMDSEKQQKNLLKAFDEHKGNNERQDDITILGFGF